MPTLRIQRPPDSIEERPLGRTAPLSVGRHDSNDVRIDEEAVGTIHCRIGWNRDGYEIVAVSDAGVDVNGTIVRSATLRAGDVIRVGSVDLRLLNDPASQPTSSQPAPANEFDEAPGLKPLASDEIPQATAPPPAPRPSSPPPPPVGAKRPPVPSRKGNETVAKRKPPADQRAARQTMENDLLDEPEDDLDELDDPELHASGTSSSRSKRSDGRRANSAAGAHPSLWKRFLALFGHRDVRPGQEDVVRSPFSIGMVTVGLVLVLVVVTLMFVIGRDRAQAAYDAATEEMNAGHYTQAMQLYEQFVERFPADERVPEARAQRGRARIEREIAGAAPNWKSGLEALDTFIRESRDRSDFTELQADVRSFANRIALGAAISAKRDLSPETLTVSRGAEQVFRRYPSPEGKPTAQLAKIDQAQTAADDAIEKQDTFDAAVAEIERTLTVPDPMAAFVERRKLLARYPELEQDAKIRELLNKTLTTERDRVVHVVLDREALVEERASATLAPTSLAVQTRTRTDQQSQGRRAVAYAGGCCYGVDTVTGAPVWRRVVGLDPPFFPVAVRTAVPGWLVFDGRHDELLLVEQETGALRWRQPVGGRVSGAPLVHEGMIYLPTLGHQLYKLDLETGRALGRLEFSQKVHTPPILTDDESHLVIAGERDMFYTVSSNPLECVGVSYLAQPPASIDVPLLKMGPLVLFIENDTQNSARLRVVQTAQPNSLRPIAEATLNGQVHDAPIIRGRNLFVSFGDESVAAYSVTDDENEQPLTRIDIHRLQDVQPGATFLTAGPDGRLWMAGDGLRKFELTATELRLEPDETVAGRFTQPLQPGSDSLFAARRMPFGDAVFFSELQRETLTGRWRVVLGAGIIGWNVTGGSAVCVTESGHAYAVNTKALSSGSFVVRGTPLDLPEDLAVPLRGAPLTDGRVAVHCGGDVPTLWVLNRAGQSAARPLKLDAPLEADPVSLAGGIVLPLPGRLKFVAPPGGKSARDFTVPMGGARPPRWKHAISVGEERMLVIDEEGGIREIEFRNMPTPHLAEVRSIPSSSPIDVAPHEHDGHITIVDAGRALRIFDATNLQRTAQTQLDGPATGTAWSTGDAVLVLVGGTRLQCFDVKDLVLRWSIPVESDLAGAPVFEAETFVAAMRNGKVMTIDPATGTVSGKLDIDQPLTDGPRRIGPHLVVPTMDGSLYRVDSLLETSP